MQTYYEKVLNRIRRPVLVVAVALVALLAASGIAVAVTTFASGGAISAVRVAGSTDKSTFTSESYVDIPGAARTIQGGDDAFDLLLARYSAESRCLGGTQTCSVRIVAVPQGGTIQEMEPASGADFGFHNASNDEAETHSMDRSLRVSKAGVYTVKAQAAAFSGSSFTLDDWSLTVERAD